MLMVLVHLYGALHPPGLCRLYKRQPPTRLSLSLIIYSLVLLCIPAAAAQDAFNVTQNDALSIIDSPAPDTVLHAGSNTSIVIDVSAGSEGFVYNFLEVYLVSSTESANITISAGSQLLTQEPDSTVKHIDWPVATCLQDGSYNLTLYEGSTFNNTGYFAIMVVPFQVDNDISSEYQTDCSSVLNPVQEQPQASNPPPVDCIPGRRNESSSTRSGTFSTSTTSSAPVSSGEIITVTAGNGEITVPLSNLPGTIVVEPSGGVSNTTVATSSGFITVTRTMASTATLTQVVTQPLTVTIEETFVSTFTAPGETLEQISTVTTTFLSTLQMVQTPVSSPQQAGLLPVNGAPRLPLFVTSLLCPLSAFALCYVHGLLFAL